MIEKSSFLPRKMITLEVILLSFVLFFLMIKAGVGSEDWEISYLPNFVYGIQGVSIYISVFLLISLFFIAFKKNSKYRISLTLFGFCFIFIWYNFRSFLVGSQDFKSLFSILILLCVYFYFSTFSKERLIIGVNSIKLTFIYWVLLNIVIYILGYGYPLTENTSRFMGVSPHANTLGSIATIGFSFYLMLYRNNKYIYYSKLFVIIIIFLCIFLVFLSGSRAALAASFLSLILVLPNVYKIVPVILSLLIYIIYISEFFSDFSIFKALDRMKEAPLDNRNEVWLGLYQDFLKSPLIGSGDASGVSGNGFLTAFGGTGMIGGMIFISIFILALFFSLKGIYSINGVKFLKEYKSDFGILFIVLAFLSIFEGYIFDKFGFIQLILLISVAYIGPFNRRQGF